MQNAEFIFGFIDGEMVLFHGFVKKIPKTPSQDCDVAVPFLSHDSDFKSE